MSTNVAAYSVSDANTAVLILDSFGNSCVSSDPGELLDFLIYSCSTRVAASSPRVFWDLDKSASCILSLMPESVLTPLASPEHKAFFDSRKLYYIPGKLFAITSKSRQEVSFYDLSQYFPEEPEPADMKTLQQKADLLMTTLSDAGIPSPRTLSSPVAVATASGLFDGVSGYHSDHS